MIDLDFLTGFGVQTKVADRPQLEGIGDEEIDDGTLALFAGNETALSLFGGGGQVALAEGVSDLLELQTQQTQLEVAVMQAGLQPDVLLAFDRTASMSHLVELVGSVMGQLWDRIKKELPKGSGLRMAAYNGDMTAPVTMGGRDVLSTSTMATCGWESTLDHMLAEWLSSIQERLSINLPVLMTLADARCLDSEVFKSAIAGLKALPKQPIVIMCYVPTGGNYDDRNMIKGIAKEFPGGVFIDLSEYNLSDPKVVEMMFGSVMKIINGCINGAVKKAAKSGDFTAAHQDMLAMLQKQMGMNPHACLTDDSGRQLISAK